MRLPVCFELQEFLFCCFQILVQRQLRRRCLGFTLPFG